MLYIVVDHLIEGAPIGWSSLMFTLLLFSGVQLLILGIAGEYIGRLYLTSNKRPQFVVRNVVTHKLSETYSNLGRESARSPSHPLS
jgi:undecaprenyl-phosphate 4-deoxy-4-formamido-L-arabinose transferase